MIAYFDDTNHALRQLVPMGAGGRSSLPTHWILVACPPRLTRHASQWLSRRARDAWRDRWAAHALQAISPMLLADGHRVTGLVAQGELATLTRQLMDRHGQCRVVDARRPRFGNDLPPVTADQPAPASPRWQVPGAVAGMGAVLVLAAE